MAKPEQDTKPPAPGPHRSRPVAGPWPFFGRLPAGYTALFRRFKNRGLARLYTRFPVLARRFTESYTPRTNPDVPWTPLRKSLSESRLALVTTAGVHHRDQPPFDMTDPDGDPTFRRPVGPLTIPGDPAPNAVPWWVAAGKRQTSPEVRGAGG